MPAEKTVRDSNGPRHKLWRCGDQHQFKVPKPEGNLWKICLEPLLEEDRLRCEAWKDEMQNLLIFAGLFSAVVTAFVIQSYQSLQPDQLQISLILLAHIASTLDDLTTTPQLNSTIYDSSPSASSIRVNTYWFLSLILSLITVLVGIVSLQWLREFQRYPSNLSPKKLFAMRAMRSEAFGRWFVPQIFAGLPLLLNLALILFFVGLLDFLLHLNRYVAIPVTILVAIAFLFLFITTTLPSLQSFWLLNVSKRRSTPPQCPYKSPQSWAFLRLSSSWIVRFPLNLIGMFLWNLAIVNASPVIFVLRLWDADHYAWRLIDHLAFTIKFKYLGRLKDWCTFDEFWMDERQRIAVRSSSSAGYFQMMVGNADYDAARGLGHLTNSNVREGTISLAVYHCFQELPIAVITDDVFDIMFQGIIAWSKVQKASRKSPLLKSPSTKMIRDENELFLLARLPQTFHTDPMHILAKRQLEVFIRTLSYLFTDEPWDPEIGHHRVTGNEPAPKRLNPGRLLTPVPLRSVKGLAALPETLLIDVREQIIMIFGSFFEMSLTTHADNLSTLGLCYKEEILGDFMQAIHVVTLSLIQSSIVGRNITSLSSLVTLVTRLARCLRLNELSSDYPRQNDGVSSQSESQRMTTLASKNLIFHISILYVSRFHYTEWAYILRRSPEFASSFQSLVSALRNYEKEVIGRAKFALNHQYYYRQWLDTIYEVLHETRQPHTGHSHRKGDSDVTVVDGFPPADQRIDITYHESDTTTPNQSCSGTAKGTSTQPNGKSDRKLDATVETAG